MENKQGLSTTLTTLIITLLVLVAVGIIWVVVRGVVEDGTEKRDQVIDENVCFQKIGLEVCQERGLYFDSIGLSGFSNEKVIFCKKDLRDLGEDALKYKFFPEEIRGCKNEGQN